jgi:AraC-like DNA-binding protein
LGYRDPRYFARLFKRHRGVGPAAWRQAAAGYRVAESD